MTGRDRAGESFWRFSLAFYARPGVSDALLSLQDRAGCNVNLVLCAVWLGAVLGCRLDAERLRGLEAAAAAAQSVAEELRGLRRRLKAEADPDLARLRGPIAALELAAERRVQERLAGSAPPVASAPPDLAARLAAAEANLALSLSPGPAETPEARFLRSAIADFLRR